MNWNVSGYAILLTALLCTSAQAVVTNGDFEDLTGWGAQGTAQPPAGWTLAGGEVNPVAQQTGSSAIGGAGTSARFSENANSFRIQQAQTINSPWQFDFDFAAEDAGDAGGRTVDLALSLAEGGNIFMRVVDVGDNGLGDVQFHDASGAGWTSVAALADSVLFSADVSAAHSANHIRIQSNFEDGTPTYDVTLSNANGSVAALDVSLFSFGSLPAVNGGGITNVAFFESATPGAAWLLDNVTLAAVPEPTSTVLVGLAGVLFCANQWRRRN